MCPHPFVMNLPHGHSADLSAATAASAPFPPHPHPLPPSPSHPPGHLSHALVTSSLLSAVGLSAGPAATAALSASIKWIVKDGVGALGRLIVGRWGARDGGGQG